MADGYITHSDILNEIRIFAANLTSLTSTVDRIDTRLVEVELLTKLIPGMSKDIREISDGLKVHDERLKLLESK